jgi:hypothetical protein
VLKLLASTVRPLSIDEFQDAISVTPGDTNLSIGKTVHGIQAILASCGNLVLLDEEQSTLHYIHSSVKQYLFGRTENDHKRIASNSNSELPDRNYFQFDPRTANMELSEIIVTYLSFTGFESQVSTTVAPSLAADEAPAKILNSTLQQSKGIQKIAAELLRARAKGPNMDVGQVLAAHSEMFRSFTLRQYHFLRYAREYWLHHTRDMQRSKATIFDMFVSLVENRTLVENTVLWQETPMDGTKPASDNMIFGAYNYHVAFLTAKRRSGQIALPELKKSIDLGDCKFSTPLPVGTSPMDMFNFLTEDHMGLRQYSGSRNEKGSVVKLLQSIPAEQDEYNSILMEAKDDPCLLRDCIEFMGTTRPHQALDGHLGLELVKTIESVYGHKQAYKNMLSILLQMNWHPVSTYSSILETAKDNPWLRIDCIQSIGNLDTRPVVDGRLGMELAKNLAINPSRSETTLWTLMRMNWYPTLDYNAILASAQHDPLLLKDCIHSIRNLDARPVMDSHLSLDVFQNLASNPSTSTATVSNLLWMNWQPQAKDLDCNAMLWSALRAFSSLRNLVCRFFLMTPRPIILPKIYLKTFNMFTVYYSAEHRHSWRALLTLRPASITRRELVYAASKSQTLLHERIGLISDSETPFNNPLFHMDMFLHTFLCILNQTPGRFFRGNPSLSHMTLDSFFPTEQPDRLGFMNGFIAACFVDPNPGHTNSACEEFSDHTNAWRSVLAKMICEPMETDQDYKALLAKAQKVPIKLGRPKLVAFILFCARKHGNFSLSLGISSSGSDHTQAHCHHNCFGDDSNRHRIFPVGDVEYLCERFVPADYIQTLEPIARDHPAFQTAPGRVIECLDS